MEFETWNRDTLIKETKAAMAGAKFHSDSFLDLLIKQKYYSDDDLHQKTDFELQDIYIQLKEQDETFCREYEESQEKGRFFNQPSCNADFSYWSKQAYWSIDEAIILILGKDPRKVIWDDVKTYIATSPFVKRFNELRELARRYVNCNELYDPVFPDIFLAWVERMSISIPTELKEAINALGIQVSDWKSRCEKASEQSNQLNKRYAEAIVSVKTKKEPLNTVAEKEQPETADLGSPEWRKKSAKLAAEARHSQPGGSRHKKEQIRTAWASGKYTSRDRCAEEECAGLDMSYATARKALRNIPNPPVT